MSPVAGLHEFAPQLAFLPPELSSIIPGGLRTTGLWSFKFMTLIPPGVLRFTTRPFYIFTGIHLRTAALSQSPVLCYFAIGDRTVFLLVVHAIALEMSVIISGQLLTLLLRGHFSPQYFPAILDVSAHRRSTLEGEDGNKSDKCQQKHNLIPEARLWLLGWAALGETAAPAAPIIAAHPGTGWSKEPLEAQSSHSAGQAWGDRGRRAPSPRHPGRALTRRRQRCSPSGPDPARSRGPPRARLPPAPRPPRAPRDTAPPPGPAIGRLRQL